MTEAYKALVLARLVDKIPVIGSGKVRLLYDDYVTKMEASIDKPRIGKEIVIIT